MKAKTLQEQIDGLRCAVEFMATSLHGNGLSEAIVMKILEYTDKRKTQPSATQEQIDIKAMAFRYANTIENHCQAYGQPSGDFLHNILVEAFEAIQNSQQSATLDEIQAEIDRRIRIIESEPEGIVKQTMIDGLTKNLPRLHSQQPTDEPKHLSSAQRQRLFDLIADIAGYHLMDDELNQIENIVYPRTYPYTLKDSQQPTVEVENIANKYSELLRDRLQVIPLNKPDRHAFVETFIEAIQEALRGTYTRSDMEQSYVGGWDAAKTHNEGETYLIFSEWITQYDTERGMVNESK